MTKRFCLPCIVLSDLSFDGVVTGSATSDDSIILPQGHYLVLSDGDGSDGVTGATRVEYDVYDVYEFTN